MGKGFRAILAALTAAFGPFLPVSAEIPFVRTESRAATPGDRPRGVPKTLVFAEREPYYPFQNYLHRWTDRPLFQDTSLRTSPLGAEHAGFARDVQVAVDAGFDGFGSLDYFGIHRWQLADLAVRPPPAGYSQMFVVPAYYAADRLEEMKAMIADVAASPHSTRLDGKLLFWAYGDTAAHRMWGRLLHAEPDVPPFRLVGDMPFYDMYEAYGQYELDAKNPRPIPDEVVAAFRDKVAAAAADLDGFQLWCTEYRTQHVGEYPRQSVGTDIYRKYLVPVCREVLGREENRGKLVGAFIRQGYVNPFTGVTDGEYGTETLRNYLDEILLLNPDILMCFEWNEANENTHFQPTVAHGKTFARVLNFYRALLDRETPKPMKGDDTSIPNLVVSVRQAIRLGEPYHLELLYLPDGAAVPSLRVRATLKDVTGATLVTLPWDTFDTGELKAVAYRIPSENLAAHEAVSVELETEYGERTDTWSGFDFTRIRATVSKDYLYSNHPLRELLRPQAVAFSAEPSAAGVDVSASVSCDEELASLEVLEGLEEVAAADAAGDPLFDRADNVVFRGEFTSLLPERFGAGSEAVLYGTAEIVGAPDAELRSGNYAWEGFGVNARTGMKWRTSCHFGGGRATFLAIVPRAQVGTARIVFDYPKLGHVEADLSAAARLGRVAYCPDGNARLTVFRSDGLPDYPQPLGGTAAALSGTLVPADPHPVYQLRAVTKSGRVWRSAPRLPCPRTEETRTLAVFSDTVGDGVPCAVADSRVTDLAYDFDAGRGAILPCRAGAAWDAQLGGGDVYCNGMYGAAGRGALPDDFARADPQWVETNGWRLLRFDGRGSFLRLPQEAIPRGAVYTLDFEILPESGEDQVLLRMQNSSGNDSGLTLAIVGGQLEAAHRGVSMWGERSWSTGLGLNVGEWNAVSVVKDFSSLTCTVNGKAFTQPYTRRAQFFSDAIFGGNVSPNENFGLRAGIRPFKGLLRSIAVRHGLRSAADARTFTWKGGQSVRRFDDPANWGLGEEDTAAQAPNPDCRLPGPDDSVYYGIGSVYRKFLFDLGGTGHVVRDFSGQTASYYWHDLSVENGALEFAGSFSNRFITAVVKAGGRLTLGPRSYSRLGESAARCSFEVNDGGRLDFGGTVLVNNLTVDVQPGGLFVCRTAFFGFDRFASTSAESLRGQGVFNEGEAVFPDGLEFGGDGSRTGAERGDAAEFRIVQRAGAMTLGGPVRRTGRYGDLDFELAGGTLNVTGNLSFEGLASCTMPAGSAVTVNVAAGCVADLSAMTFGGGTVLTGRGPGRIVFGASVPAVYHERNRGLAVLIR